MLLLKLITTGKGLTDLGRRLGIQAFSCVTVIQSIKILFKSKLNKIHRLHMIKQTNKYQLYIFILYICIFLYIYFIILWRHFPFLII